MAELPSAEELSKKLWNEECPHCEFLDDDPYHRANPYTKRSCGKCLTAEILADRNAALETAAAYFERFPGAFTGRMIAADLRKRKEEPCVG